VLLARGRFAFEGHAPLTAQCAKNARYWHKLKPPRFPLPQTPFKTVGVVERFWACIEDRSPAPQYGSQLRSGR
jgi:hypothetical protein